MSEEIKPLAVYTTDEAQKLLKISKSTVKRLLKKGLLRANKVGKQYRILGRELLHLVSPKLEGKATDAYLRLKKSVVDTLNSWG